MHDWIMLILGTVYIILVLIEASIEYFSLKPLHSCQRLLRNLVGIEDGKYKNEAISLEKIASGKPREKGIGQMVRSSISHEPIAGARHKRAEEILKSNC